MAVASWNPIGAGGESDTFDYIDLSAVDQDLKEITGARSIPFSEAPSRARQLVRSGDILVSTVRPNLNGVAMVPPELDGATASTGFCVLRADPEKLEPRYLFHWVKTSAFIANMVRLATGASYPAVSDKIVLASRIPLPPLPEQRRIAAILDKADALCAKRREALAQLDRLAQSIFVEMFGDPVTNPKGWPKRRLDHIFGIARGGSPRPIDDYITDAPDGVNWVMIGDTEEGGKYIFGTRKKIRPEGVRRSRVVKDGDFLLTNSMSFGRPYIMRTSGCIHDGWLVLSPRTEDFSPDYFYALLGTRAVYSEFSRRAAGATVKNLNIDLVSGVEVAIPPVEHQRRFAEAIADIEKTRARHQASLLEFSNLFQSIQHRAFRGEL